MTIVKISELTSSAGVSSGDLFISLNISYLFNLIYALYTLFQWILYFNSDLEYINESFKVLHDTPVFKIYNSLFCFICIVNNLIIML